MNDQTVDLLVIGCGASGASVAYEAVRRGLRVAILEAGDIGGGTSCRSTKLLHGGVRYLELAFKTPDIAQLKLVREALLERGHWLKEAPFLARRLELALPTPALWNQAYYRVGLGLYDALAGGEGIGSSRLLSREAMAMALPELKAGLSGVAYSDGQFDDARLNLLLALSAEQGGAQLQTRCRVVGFERNQAGRLSGAVSEDREGRQQRWMAAAIVNATGIQSDAIRQLADPSASPRMLTSRGSHLVIAEDLCPEGVGLLVPSTADGRVLFMLPFFGRTLVGTTDEACSLDEATAPSEAEEQYLLRYIRDWFPAVQNPTVTSRWAGGRPLIKPADSDRDSSRVVREHDVETLPCGLVSVMGGKWTTCRPMAIDTLRAVEQQLNRPLAQPTAMPLLGSASTPEQTRAELLKQQVKLQDVLPDTPLRDAQVMHLQSSFGLRALSVIADQSNAELEPLSGVIPLCRAEIRHVIDKEHVFSTTDVLARRCRLAMVDQNDAETVRPTVESLLIEAGISRATASRDLDLSMND